MKLGLKLLAAPVLTGLVALGAGALNAGYAAQESAASEATFTQDMENLHTIAAVQDQMGQLHAGVYRTITLMASMDEAGIKAFRDSLGTQLEGVKRTMAGIDDAAAADAAARERSASVARQIDKYKAQADSAIDLSTVDANTGIAAVQGADSTFRELTGTLGLMVSQIKDDGVLAASASRSRTRQASLWLGLLALVATGTAIGMSIWMQRQLVADLSRASKLADEVAHGNLTVDAKSDRTDEVGELIRSLAAMAAQLHQSVHAVMQSSSSIRDASAEIAIGNDDLSGRTEQTASNLQQTAGSIEQLTGTVKQSADSARQANQLASSAAEVAQRGGSVVSQVVATMDDIHAYSRKIADITGVIDGIAFQTNILALNAAVEAARAGEQGRGFAVVAGEVRLLAKRSAEAAKEIKELISSSRDKVESGSRLVANAGQTMNEIVASVKRVSDMIGEITAAAEEQSVGFGSINIAISQLDDMTQQNAALVEESTAAAESLKDQAHRLAQVVGQFRLRDNTAALKPREIAAQVIDKARAEPRKPTPPPIPSKVATKVSAVPKTAVRASMQVAAKTAPPKTTSVASPAMVAIAPLMSATAAASAASDGDWETF